jgi:hypothetical protein
MFSCLWWKKDVDPIAVMGLRMSVDEMTWIRKMSATDRLWFSFVRWLVAKFNQVREGDGGDHAQHTKLSFTKNRLVSS